MSRIEMVGSMMSAEQLDRVVGVLVGTATGDGLGAGYEFGPALPPGEVAVMEGGGTFDWEPGEWTDDTSMAIAIAEVAATGRDLLDPKSQAAIGSRWCSWAKTASDVGIQTRAVLSQAERSAGQAPLAAADLYAAALDLHETRGRSGGNGSLMRTAPVALAYLDDPDGLTKAALAISSLTHYDPEAGQACVLWCHAIRHAVLSGERDIRIGLSHLPDEVAATWRARIEAAESGSVSDFPNNGWVVHAFQEAWCGIATTANEDVLGNHLERALQLIVCAGGDTDTVAAIAGGLLGGQYGSSQIPNGWRAILHGWPDLTGDDLGRLALRIVSATAVVELD